MLEKRLCDGESAMQKEDSFETFRKKWMYCYAEVLRLIGEYKDGEEPWDDVRYIEDVGDGYYVIHAGAEDNSWRATMRFRVKDDYIADISAPEKSVFDAERHEWCKVMPDCELYDELDRLIHVVAIPEMVASLSKGVS